MKYWELNIIYMPMCGMWKIDSRGKVIKTDNVLNYDIRDVRTVIRSGRLFIIKGLNRWSL